MLRRCTRRLKGQIARHPSKTDIVSDVSEHILLGVALIVRDLGIKVIGGAMRNRVINPLFFALQLSVHATVVSEFWFDGEPNHDQAPNTPAPTRRPLEERVCVQRSCLPPSAQVEFHAIEYAQHCLSLLGIKRRDLAICRAQRLIGGPGLIGCKHLKRLRPQGCDLPKISSVDCHRPFGPTVDSCT